MEIPAEGLMLLLNKPIGWTSFDVVRKLRYTLKIKKIGHAGTLDPLASGLLIVCAGKMTKQIDAFMGMEKEYTGTLTIGHTTPSYDLETQPENGKEYHHITKDFTNDVFKKFVGEIEQIPPAHSAIKVNGKRAYELARKGEEVDLKKRKITITSFEITKFDLPLIDFKVVCSKGTYIRSLARDVGEALGTGAYLSALCRTRIGDFLLENAKEITSFKKDETQETL